MTNPFKGLYAANIVPLNKNKTINIPELKKHLADILQQKHIKGLLVNGHAGENFTLSEKEFLM